jgi:hypothetical protein
MKLCVFFAAGSCCVGQAIESNAPGVPAAEVQQFLKAICPGHATESGCNVCPEDTSSAGSGEAWNTGTIFLGHFLSRSSRDALVNGSGCEAHPAGWSGSFLLTFGEGSWRKVRYMGGTRARDCRQLPGSDGRDRLVCEYIDSHFGALDLMLFLMDPGKDPSTVTSNAFFDDDFERSFFGATDNTGAGACHIYPEDDDAVDGLLQLGTIDRVEFANLPAKYHVRIVAYGSEGSIKIAPKLREQVCSGDAPEPDVTPAAKPTRDEFIFDGTKVAPVPVKP